MRNYPDRYSGSCSRRMWLAGLLCVPVLSLAQNTTLQSKGDVNFNVQASLKQLNAGQISSYDVHKFGQQNIKEAVPGLEKQFSMTQNEMDKMQIAQVLVKLKDRDDLYWNYLAQVVTSILDNPSPSPIATDSQGKELPGIPPAFEAWVDANKLDPPVALQNATYVQPGYMLLLGLTDDSRAVPLLRRAVLSPNYIIAVQASEALAQLKDEDGASVVAEAASKAPASAAALIAEPLGYYRSTIAQSAFERYVPKQRAQAVRERVRAGQHPLE